MLILICGIGRAGKTTYSKQFNNVIHFDLMGKISKRYDYINKIASQKTNIVIEGIYNHKQYRIALLKAYKGKNKKCIWLNTSKETVLKRMAKDGIPVSRYHFDFEPPTYDEGWDKIIIIQEEN